jgi:hypothetical protein
MPINWERVRRLARQSFRGSALGPEDFAYLQVAFDSDPARYKREGDDVRAEERRAINPMEGTD